ncbi:GNAT family N-acetyltransferase [Niallia sp. 01092]|uniref:GNAT family N-acetyltransferase n=1 Tax=unclassified Niallia TaxID=2837522 RepID=UPI003FD29C5D
MQKTIRQAQPNDLNKIRSFLQKTAIDRSGMEKWLEYYLLVEDVNGKIVGTIGIQPFKKLGLLRSLVLSNASAEEILYLLQQTIKMAKDKELETLYCMLNNKQAIQLFSLLGFNRIEKTALPHVLKKSNTVNNLSTVNNLEFMCYSLKNVDK